jgi:hypothetical protein
MQHSQGQVGEERLMHVDHVEPLAQQDPAHALSEQRVQGDARDGAVEGHGDRAPHRVDVALDQRPLGPRFGSQDGHFVSQPAELAGEMAHVRAYSAWIAPIIRRDHPDVHAFVPLLP